MRKIFALACATSALAIVTAANAGGGIGIGSTGNSFQVTIQGTVPGYCTIAGSGTITVTNGSYAGTDKTGLLKIDKLGDSNGKLQDVSASGTFSMNANESCHLSLLSTKGGLFNLSNPSANNILYSAIIFDKKSSPDLVPVIAPGKIADFFSQFDPKTLGNEDVSFSFKIAGSSDPVAAGNYQDVLTLSLEPTI